jgi:multidrug efflux pump subunit AcrA (membrane-fusion protein)
VSGIVSGVLVEAGQAVEYGQALAEVEALPDPLDGQVGAPPDAAVEDVPANGSDR